MRDVSDAAPTRLLLLGIDAASSPLVDAWIDDGTLPHLRDLRDRGISGGIRGIEGFYVGSTWPSLYTGTSPARHGVHYQLQIVPGTDRLHWCPDAEFVRMPPFWSALTEAGRRVAVLDVPLTRLAPVNGIQVVEWGGHDHLYGFGTYPSELGERLRARHGDHPLGVTCDGARRGVEDWRAFLHALEEGVRRKTDLTLELLEGGGWDCFMQVFTEAHCAGHQSWHLHDPRHPGHDPALAAELGDPLRRIYRRVDAAVGEIVEAAGDTRIVVFAGHGMDHWFGAQFLLPRILETLGVTVLPDDSGSAAAEGTSVRLARALWNRLPDVAKDPVRGARHRLSQWGAARRGTTDPAARAIPPIAADLEQSLCFPLNNGQAVGGIRLNLSGREPGGLLEPGPQADAFCADLADKLLAIVDERTGRPLVRRVLRTRDLYEGEHLDALPDLLVEWSDEAPTGSTLIASGAGAEVRAHSPSTGPLSAVNTYGRTGEHRPGGWFVAAGPGMSTGRMERPISLLDLAPTFTEMLGIALPTADGHAIPELLGSPVHIENDRKVQDRIPKETSP